MFYCALSWPTAFYLFVAAAVIYVEIVHIKIVHINTLHINISCEVGSSDPRSSCIFCVYSCGWVALPTGHESLDYEVMSFRHGKGSKLIKLRQVWVCSN